MELPENAHEKILSFCDVDTKLNLSETCTHLNRLLFSSPKLIDKIELNLNCRYFQLEIEADGNPFLIILANQRKYQNLNFDGKMTESQFAPDFMKCLTTMSSSVQEVQLSAKYLDCHRFVQIFEILKGTEKLTLRVQSSNFEAVKEISKTSNFLLNLKDLDVSISIQVLELLVDVKTLTRLQLYVSDREIVSIQDFGNFIMQQTGLKHLSITELKEQTIRWSAFAEAEFLLESLIVFCYSLDRGALKFFMKQSELKTINIRMMKPTADIDTVKAILTSPNLQSLRINGFVEQEDLNVLSDISNPSILKLNYSGHDSVVLEALISYFPNVKEVNFDQSVWELTETPCEKLSILKYEHLRSFSYQPSFFNIDVKQFEKIVSDFLTHHSDITHLTIGHRDWIENDFTLSKSFCLKLSKLHKLEVLILYNPKAITDFIILLQNMRTNILATIYTSAAGVAAVTADGPHKRYIGAWLKIKICH